MFNYACIATLCLITYFAKEYKLLCYFLLFEFLALEAVYVLGYLPGLLEYEPLYVAFVLVQTYTIRIMLQFQRVWPIILLIFANLSYNVLTIKQLVLTQQGVATFDDR